MDQWSSTQKWIWLEVWPRNALKCVALRVFQKRNDIDCCSLFAQNRWRLDNLYHRHKGPYQRCQYTSRTPLEAKRIRRVLNLAHYVNSIEDVPNITRMCRNSQDKPDTSPPELLLFSPLRIQVLDTANQSFAIQAKSQARTSRQLMSNKRWLWV